MVARDGWLFIFIGLILTVMALYGANRWDSWPAFVLSLMFGMLTIFTAFFFRDPERTVALEPHLLVAPADGKIVVVDTLANHPFIGGPTVQVSIFLSVFNVHVNRIPASGSVDYVKYNPGKFLAAYEDKASEVNEQTEIGMTVPSGQRIVFKQIAGLIARRIVCRLESGDHVTGGDRFGMIKFGSRTDLLIPADSRLTVALGDRVKGGETVMGYLSGVAASSKTVEVRKEKDEGL